MTPEEQKEIDDLRTEYFSLGHAIQSGIAFCMECDSKFVTVKHLREGINMSKSDMGGLAALLIEKGVITELEYMRAIVKFARQEKESYERWANELTGTNNIKFG